MLFRTALTRDHLPISHHFLFFFYLLYCFRFSPIPILGKTCYQSSTPEFRVSATPPRGLHFQAFLGDFAQIHLCTGEGRGQLCTSLGEAGRSRSQGPRGKLSPSPPPHRLGSQVPLLSSSRCLCPAEPSPPMAGRFKLHAQGRGREAVQAGH